MLASSIVAAAEDDVVPVECDRQQVLAHVQSEFAQFGPRSRSNEYFGFIYRIDGRIESAVTRGSDCRGQSDCTVNSAGAGKRIPRGAQVLGEWHTHPHIGSPTLSEDDVKGANANRRIRCYAAFYSTPGRDIYRWSVDSTSLPEAMSTRVQVGTYARPILDARKQLRGFGGQ